jgi:hypothetical protein
MIARDTDEWQKDGQAELQPGQKKWPNSEDHFEHNAP